MTNAKSATFTFGPMPRIADDRRDDAEGGVRENDGGQVARPAQGKEREERGPRAGREEVQGERRLDGALKVRRRVSRRGPVRARQQQRGPGPSSRARGSSPA